MSEGRYRVAVVGARRRRQGTGEYIAREFARLGCEVRAIVGTTAATVAAACQALRERYRIECRGFLSLEALLAQEPVDVVAVCSPPEVHLAQLELAASCGVHVFCEKPLWWSTELAQAADSDEVRGRATRLMDRFSEARRYLALNTQWPYTLPAFRGLHPDADLSVLDHFRMWLSPLSAGTSMLVDAAPHLLSMLRALAGAGRLHDIRARYEERPGLGARSGLRLTCGYEHAHGTAEVEFLLERCPQPPRPAGYSVNGFGAQRHIELPSYLISFVDKGRRVPVPDPLAAAVEDFVNAVRAGRMPDRASIIDGMTQLHELVVAGEGSKGL